jgi:hypothetical protein
MANGNGGGVPKINFKPTGEIGNIKIFSDIAKRWNIPNGLEVVPTDSFGWKLPDRGSVDLGSLPARQVFGSGGPGTLSAHVPLVYSLGKLRDPSTNAFTFPTPMGDKTFSSAEMLELVRASEFKNKPANLKDGDVVTNVVLMTDHQAKITYQRDGKTHTALVDGFDLVRAIEGKVRVLDLAKFPMPTAPFELAHYNGKDFGLQLRIGDEMIWVDGFQMAGLLHMVAGKSVDIGPNDYVNSIVLRPDGKATVGVGDMVGRGWDVVLDIATIHRALVSVHMSTTQYLGEVLRSLAKAGPGEKVNEVVFLGKEIELNVVGSNSDGGRKVTVDATTAPEIVPLGHVLSAFRQATKMEDSLITSKVAIDGEKITITVAELLLDGGVEIIVDPVALGKAFNPKGLLATNS